MMPMHGVLASFSAMPVGEEAFGEDVLLVGELKIVGRRSERRSVHALQEPPSSSDG